MIWTWCVEHGIDCELINNGDDCVIIVEREFQNLVMESLPKWMWKAGFEVVMERPVDEFEEIVFCQTQPVRLSSGWRMVRNPFTCLKKDVMCLRPMQNAKCFKKWMYAVGAAGGSLCSGVPVLESFYGMMSRNGVKSDHYKDLVSPFRFGAKASSKAVVTPEARSSFWAAFGVLPRTQMLLEREFDGSTIGDLDCSRVLRRELLELELPGAQIFNNEHYIEKPA